MLQDIAILTGATVISEEVGLKLENATIDLLGTARKIVVTKDETTIVEGAGKDEDIQRPHQPDQVRDREDGLRLRPREAPGAPGEALRRRRGDQGRRGHRGRAQGEEAPHRGRRAVHEGCRRGGHRARRWRGPAERAGGPRQDRPRGRRADRRRRSCAARSRSRSSRSRSTPASRAASWSRRSARSTEGQGLNAATGEYGDMLEYGIVDPAKVTRSALQNAAVDRGAVPDDRGGRGREAGEDRRRCPAAAGCPAGTWTSRSPRLARSVRGPGREAAGPSALTGAASPCDDPPLGRAEGETMEATGSSGRVPRR